MWGRWSKCTSGAIRQHRKERGWVVVVVGDNRGGDFINTLNTLCPLPLGPICSQVDYSPFRTPTEWGQNSALRCEFLIGMKSNQRGGLVSVSTCGFTIENSRKQFLEVVDSVSEGDLHPVLGGLTMDIALSGGSNNNGCNPVNF